MDKYAVFDKEGTQVGVTFAETAEAAIEAVADMYCLDASDLRAEYHSNQRFSPHCSMPLSAYRR